MTEQKQAGHSSVVQHQGGVNLQQGDTATGEVCQGSGGLEVPADYV